MKELLIVFVMIFSVGYAIYVTAEEPAKPAEITEEATKPEVVKGVIEEVVASSDKEVNEDSIQESATPVEGMEDPANK